MSVDIDLLRSLISLQDLAESGTRNMGTSLRGAAVDYTAPYQQQLIDKQAEFSNWEAAQENKTPTDSYSNTAAFDAYTASLASWVGNLTQANNYNSYQGPALYSNQPNLSRDVYGLGSDGLKDSASGASYFVPDHFTSIPDVAKSLELSRRDSSASNPGTMARPDYTATGFVTTDAAPDMPTISGDFTAEAPSVVGKAMDRGIRSQQNNLRAIALGEGDISDLKYAKININTARDMQDEVEAYGSDYAAQVQSQVDAYEAATAAYRSQIAGMGNRTYAETVSERANSPARAYDNSLATSQSYLNSAIGSMAYSPVSYLNQFGGNLYGTATTVANHLGNAAAHNPGSVGNRIVTYNPYQTLKNNQGQPGSFLTLPDMPAPLSISDAPEYTSTIDTRWLDKRRRKKKVEAITRS